MSKNLLTYLISKNNPSFRYPIRLLTNNSNNKEIAQNENLPQKTTTSKKETPKSVTLKEIPVILDKYIKKARGEYDDNEEKEERKGPFKNYFEDDERNKKSIMFYEQYFEKNAKEKNRENFIVRYITYILKYSRTISTYFLLELDCG